MQRGAVHRKLGRSAGAHQGPAGGSLLDSCRIVDVPAQRHRSAQQQQRSTPHFHLERDRRVRDSRLGDRRTTPLATERNSDVAQADERNATVATAVFSAWPSRRAVANLCAPRNPRLVTDNRHALGAAPPNGRPRHGSTRGLQGWLLTGCERAAARRVRDLRCAAALAATDRSRWARKRGAGKSATGRTLPFVVLSGHGGCSILSGVRPGT
jgi:hypothetical protein